MEKIEIKVENNIRDDAIRNYQLFKWELVNEQKDLKETTLTFSRDNEVPYYNELVKLENQFNKIYTIPSWISYVLIVLTLVYVSVIAILWLTHVFPFDKSIIAIILAIPTGIFLLLNVLVSYLRSRQFDNHVKHKEEKYQKYQEKVNELINK